MRGGIDGTLQLGYQFGHGAVHIAGDAANGPPIVRLPRKNPDCLKQHGGRDVVAVGDKWDRHPATHGLIFRADLPCVPAGPVGEDERTGDRQQEGEANRKSAPPRFCHDSL